MGDRWRPPWWRWREDPNGWEGYGDDRDDTPPIRTSPRLDVDEPRIDTDWDDLQHP